MGESNWIHWSSGMGEYDLWFVDCIGFGLWFGVGQWWSGLVEFNWVTALHFEIRTSAEFGFNVCCFAYI